MKLVIAPFFVSSSIAPAALPYRKSFSMTRQPGCLEIDIIISSAIIRHFYGIALHLAGTNAAERGIYFADGDIVGAAFATLHGASARASCSTMPSTYAERSGADIFCVSGSWLAMPTFSYSRAQMSARTSNCSNQNASVIPNDRRGRAYDSYWSPEIAAKSSMPAPHQRFRSWRPMPGHLAYGMLKCDERP